MARRARARDRPRAGARGAARRRRRPRLCRRAGPGVARDALPRARRDRGADVRRILVIARLTLAEAARRRLFLALVVLTVVSVGLSAWGFAQIAAFAPAGATPDQTAAARPIVVSQFLVVVTFMYTFILALGAALLAGPMVTSDSEGGVAMPKL